MSFSITPAATSSGIKKVQHFKVSIVGTKFILLPILPVNQSKTILYATVAGDSVALSFIDDSTILIERATKKGTVECGIQILEYF